MNGELSIDRRNSVERARKLRAEITAAKRKLQRLQEAISVREQILSRLEAAVVLDGPAARGRTSDD